MTEVTFKISSGLKSIIGKELITDDFIAVFELVKNSFDANAKNVDIIFNGLDSDYPCIIIKDDGNGMNSQDIKDKWLFLAYSEKKMSDDYRDKIISNRVYAGAKGIGRFSCDRLGRQLKMISKKKEDKEYHLFEVDWKDFEVDPKAEFQTINASLQDIDEHEFSKFQSGTILQIMELRSHDWNREKLLKLRQSLERLINPNQGNDIQNFSINLIVPNEVIEDNQIKKNNPDELWKIVNGPIKNFIFEALELKTTQIKVEIDRDGDTLLTELRDRGTLIYELLENNPYPKILKDIRINLFFLNQSAKINFALRMGVRTRDYGSVFLYKNGFRIHPYGDLVDDSFEIDRRKQQGIFRYLGSRDLSGRIEINGNNPAFQETSSRDGGLIKNKEFYALRDLFIEYALKRLENYVIELGKFGKGLEEIPEIQDPSSGELRNIAFDLIVNLTNSQDVVDIHYDPKILNIVENKSAESVTALLKNLRRISVEQNNEELHKEILKAEKQVETLKKAKEEAEKETEKERERAKQAEQETREAQAQTEKAQEEAREARRVAEESEERVDALETQNIFLKSVLSEDLQHVLNLHHTIKTNAITIETFVDGLLKMLRDGKTIKTEMLQSTLELISLTARKIVTISRFSTKANFQADAEEVTMNLVAYIREYILNIHKDDIFDPYNQLIDISFYSSPATEFVTTFRPINVR